MFQQHVSARARSNGSSLKTAIAGAVLALGLSQAAQAVVVFDNGAPDLVSGVNMSASTVAEDFTLGSTTTITGITFWSIQSARTDFLGSLAIGIFADNAGSPGAELLGNAGPAAITPTGRTTAFGYAEYIFNIPIGAPALPAGSYWLGLANFPVDPDTPTEMLWETTAPGKGSKAKYFDSNLKSWVSAAQDLAFNISGNSVVNPTPEPATLALLGLSLAAAGFMRRKA